MIVSDAHLSPTKASLFPTDRLYSDKPYNCNNDQVSANCR